MSMHMPSGEFIDCHDPTINILGLITLLPLKKVTASLGLLLQCLKQ